MKLNTRHSWEIFVQCWEGESLPEHSNGGAGNRPKLKPREVSLRQVPCTQCEEMDKILTLPSHHNISSQLQSRPHVVYHGLGGQPIVLYEIKKVLVGLAGIGGDSAW